MREGCSSVLQTRWEKASVDARLRGQAGNERLHRQWIQFTAKKKRPVVAIIALARELAGWCWSLAVIYGQSSRPLIAPAGVTTSMWSDPLSGYEQHDPKVV